MMTYKSKNNLAQFLFSNKNFFFADILGFIDLLWMGKTITLSFKFKLMFYYWNV